MRKICIFTIIILFAACTQPKDIQLGFLGILSGKMGDLGVSGRDGAVLAVDVINENGGINGRMVNLISEDNEFDELICREKAQLLVNKNIEGLIGTMSSDMALACIDIFNEAEIPMISPTASTPRLSDIDDYFLRVNPSDESEGKTLALYTTRHTNGKKFAVIYDKVNESYTHGVYTQYANAVKEIQDADVAAFTFISDENPEFSSLIKAVLHEGPSAVFIVASAIDTGTICQQIRKQRSDVLILATGWAMTDELIKQGGPAADGVVFNHYHNSNSSAPAYRQFVKEFSSRFNRNPDFIAALSYNAVSVWKEAYLTKDKDQNVKSRIIEIGTFDGLQGEIFINKFGDAFLERHYITVKNGEFVDI